MSEQNGKRVVVAAVTIDGDTSAESINAAVASVARITSGQPTIATIVGEPLRMERVEGRGKPGPKPGRKRRGRKPGRKSKAELAAIAAAAGEPVTDTPEGRKLAAKRKRDAKKARARRKAAKAG